MNKVNKGTVRGSRLTPQGSVLRSFILFFFVSLCPIHAQNTILLEEKARFEAAWENRVQDVLVRILGPNKSKVIIEAETAFVPLPVGSLGSGARRAPPASYQRQIGFPSTFIKRLSVTVLIDRGIPDVQTGEIRQIVSDLLAIKPDLGDAFTLIRAGFPPPWKTLWQRPETMGLMLKYALMSILSLITLVVVAVCFLKLTSAMNSMASTQSQQITMDRQGAAAGSLGDQLTIINEESPAGRPKAPHLQSSGGQQAVGDPPLAGQRPPKLYVAGARPWRAPLLESAGYAAGLLEEPRVGITQRQASPPPAAEAGDQVFIEVAPGQIDHLVEMTKQADPDVVTLIALHLRSEVKKKFCSHLAPDLSEIVTVKLGKSRFVEPDVAQKLKDEVERRLAATVGGINELMTVVDGFDMPGKKRLLARLETEDPNLAKKVRARIFLIEDLALLSSQDWSHVIDAVGHEEWAAALAEGPAEAVNALKSNLTQGAQKIIEQLMAADAPPPASRRVAQGKIAAVVERLIQEGSIRHPVL